MPAYDDRFFNPPGPLARVTLRTSSDVNAVTDVPMLIDSGADVTMVPQQSIDLLGVTVDSEAALRSWVLTAERALPMSRVWS